MKTILITVCVILLLGYGHGDDVDRAILSMGEGHDDDKIGSW
jgi:hypothetical protein